MLTGVLSCTRLRSSASMRLQRRPRAGAGFEDQLARVGFDLVLAGLESRAGFTLAFAVDGLLERRRVVVFERPGLADVDARHADAIAALPR